MNSYRRRRIFKDIFYAKWFEIPVGTKFVETSEDNIGNVAASFAIGNTGPTR